MKNYTLFLSLSLLGLFSQAQNISRAVESFEKETQATITFNKNLEAPAFIKSPLNKELSISGKTVKEKAYNFLLKNKSIYDIKNIEETFSSKGVLKIDNYGLKHYEVKQLYKGISVFDGGLKFHFNKNGNITSINGNIIPKINLNVIPRLQETEANSIALEIINNLNINHSGKPLKIISNELLIFPKGLVQGNVTSNHLAYRIEVRNDLDVREFLFIDAHTGKLVEQFTGIAHAIDRVLYNATRENKIWEEGVFFPGFLDEWQQAEIKAAGHMYYFFKNAFNYISYDGEDGQMVTVHNDPDIPCPNATWGGGSTNFCNGTASDDVVAHEWGHAYTEKTSNLIYAYESGAMNESFSDIWGETIDLLNNYSDEGEDLSVRNDSNFSTRWLVGEDATAFGGESRDMWDPTRFNNPGRLGSDGYYVCDYENFDNGGVHSNSGVSNHAYALLVDGGTFNGQTIAGLGFTKSAHIFWRAQSQYLTPSSDFGSLADALDAACADLVGINLEGLSTTETPAGPSGEIITMADCQELAKVILATELRGSNGCDYPTVLNPISEPLCSAATSNPIFVEDWESGFGNWVLEQIPVDPFAWESRDWVIRTLASRPEGGQVVYALDPLTGVCRRSDGSGGIIQSQAGIIRLESPTITMPNYQNGEFNLAFNHSMASEAWFDAGNIKYSLNGGEWIRVPYAAFTENPYNFVLDPTGNNNPLLEGSIADLSQEWYVFTGTDVGSHESAWGRSVINLSSIGVVANSTLKLRWEFGTDDCNGRDGWYVDDIVVYNCSEALSTNDFNFLNNNISIYPNPSSGIFNLKMKNISNLHYNVYDIRGKEIMSGVDVSNDSFQLDLSNYSKGIYFLKLYSKGNTTTKKLIVK